MYTRKQILEMLSAGEIDVPRATQLLSEAHASDAPPAAEMPPAPPEPPASPAPPRLSAPPEPGKGGRRWLRIHVSDLDGGQNRVRVNVPLGLVSLGLKVSAHFTDEINEGVIKNVLDALEDDQITGTLVEVEDVDDNEHVHIFID